MPELPEIEIICRGLKPLITGQVLNKVIIRRRDLRWPIQRDLPQIIKKQVIRKITRLGKYLLLHFDRGTLIIHLGMSGKFYITKNQEYVGKHDHVDFYLANDLCLRFSDTRRFGSILWTHQDPQKHPLLRYLGIEPLGKNFTGKYLFLNTRKHKVMIKKFIMIVKILLE